MSPENILCRSGSILRSIIFFEKIGVIINKDSFMLIKEKRHIPLKMCRNVLMKKLLDFGLQKFFQDFKT